ncbi:sigma-70 family RNA polymerase sigma factor [Nocardioides sp. R1-1]|uniref:sigma-70 family RNA polymerase sigma factor n=1 Tax=Nocardioides sp. R1-1 TaxID=3383502 RepID=UPI0038D1D76E
MNTHVHAHDVHDDDLVRRTREGDLDAYAALYERHAAAALSRARRLGAGAHSEDLVAEAFTRVLDALRRGLGPSHSFRGYLLTSIRMLWLNSLRDTQRIDGGDACDAGLATRGSVDDDAAQRFERQAVRAAFHSLPERWRVVLWCTQVHGLSHAETAGRLGIAPNAVAALSFRAREGLRQAFLEEHVRQSPEPRCRAMRQLLSLDARGALPPRRRRSFEAHVERCPACRAARVELAEVNRHILPRRPRPSRSLSAA